MKYEGKIKNKELAKHNKNLSNNYNKYNKININIDTKNLIFNKEFNTIPKEDNINNIKIENNFENSKNNIDERNIIKKGYLINNINKENINLNINIDNNKSFDINNNIIDNISNNINKSININENIKFGYSRNKNNNLNNYQKIGNKYKNNKIFKNNILLKPGIKSNSPINNKKLNLDSDIMKNLFIDNKSNKNDIIKNLNINTINDINYNRNKVNDIINNNEIENNIQNIAQLKNKTNLVNIKNIYEESRNNINIKSKSTEKKVVRYSNPNNKINLNKNNYLFSNMNKIDTNNISNRNTNNYLQFNTDKDINKYNIISLEATSEKPKSYRILKLNLNDFTTRKTIKNINNSNSQKKIYNIKCPSECNLERNKPQESQVIVFNGIENDNIINGLSKENLVDINEELGHIKDDEIINNINYRRLKTDLFHSKNNYTNRNKKSGGKSNEKSHLLRNNKNLSSINKRNKLKQKISFFSNTIDGNNPIYNTKLLKSQYPLFFNSHDYNDNIDSDSNSKTKNKKNNKLLIKNLSNLKINKPEKKKQKDILSTNPNYLDVSYFNKYNNNLKLNSNIYNKISDSLNEGQFQKGLKPPLPLSNIRAKTKDYNKVINDTDVSCTQNNFNNRKNNKRQNYNSLKYINNNQSSINKTINSNINSYQISKNYDALNNLDENDNDNYYNNYFNDKSNDISNIELKKLLEKNLENYSYNMKSDIDAQKIFAQGIMESFCYFKIINKDSPQFNPLDSCAVNPETLGYWEGYISIDVILGHLKIIPKKNLNGNFKSNNIILNNKIYCNNNQSISEKNFYNNLYNINNNGKNNYLLNNNFENNENSVCLRIELKEICGIKINKHMQDIMKIHNIFLKYNSHSGMQYEDNNGRIKKRVLSINKLIYMKEITAIKMDQNEKIKAALCNFFAFTLIFGKNKNKVECIFINFDQFNIWNKCLETIVENNNKSKNGLNSYRVLFHKKYNSNSHNKNNDNGNNTRDNYIYSYLNL